MILQMMMTRRRIVSFCTANEAISKVKSKDLCERETEESGTILSLFMTGRCSPENVGNMDCICLRLANQAISCSICRDE